MPNEQDFAKVAIVPIRSPLGKPSDLEQCPMREILTKTLVLPIIGGALALLCLAGCGSATIKPGTAEDLTALRRDGIAASVPHTPPFFVVHPGSTGGSEMVRMLVPGVGDPNATFESGDQLASRLGLVDPGPAIRDALRAHLIRTHFADFTLDTDPRSIFDRERSVKEAAAKDGAEGVYVFRPGGALALPGVALLDERHFTHLFVDGALAGQLIPGSFLFLPLSPGPHRLRSTAENDADLDVTVETGRPLFVQQDDVMGFARTRTRLRTAGPAEGKAAIERLAQSPIARVAGSGSDGVQPPRFVLDVQTLSWGLTHGPSGLTRFVSEGLAPQLALNVTPFGVFVKHDVWAPLPFEVVYYVRAFLVDRHRGKVVAGGACGGTSKEGLKYSELVANGALRLRSALDAAAKNCLEKFTREAFGSR